MSEPMTQLPLPLHPPILLCPHCGMTEVPRVTPQSEHITKAICVRCDAFIKLLPRRLMQNGATQTQK
jgi:hypothetical protein